MKTVERWGENTFWHTKKELRGFFWIFFYYFGGNKCDRKKDVLLTFFFIIFFFCNQHDHHQQMTHKILRGVGRKNMSSIRNGVGKRNQKDDRKFCVGKKSCTSQQISDVPAERQQFFTLENIIFFSESGSSLKKKQSTTAFRGWEIEGNVKSYCHADTIRLHV